MSKSKKIKYVKEMEERHAFLVFVICTAYVILFLFAQSFNPEKIADIVKLSFTFIFYGALIVMFIIFVFLIFRIIKVSLLNKKREKRMEIQK